MIKGRVLDNLGDEELALRALQEIEVQFGSDYLLSKTNKSPLSLLWNRCDRLATVELFTIGYCILKIKENNEGWLKSTIREMKRCSQKTKGLISEIIFFGMFSTARSAVNPAKNNNPGYDFSIEMGNGFTQYISVKNIDISDEKLKFQANCKRVRVKWREKLRFLKKNLSLNVLCDGHISSDDFDLIIDYIKKANEIWSNTSTELRVGLLLSIKELPTAHPVSPAHVSDVVIICCAGHESEKRRYANRLAQAAKNIQHHTSKLENALRVIFIRVNVHANYNDIFEKANQIINDPSYAVDCLIIHQPSYARDRDNKSMIHHCVGFAVTPRYAINLGEGGYGGIEFPLGCFSMSQAPVKIINKTTSEEFDAQPTDYIFQQGDIYNLGGYGEFISIGSPAQGIREHGVCYINGEYLVVDPKQIPRDDNLILI